jgi:Na+/H+-dicarboxylate symporter
MLALRVIAGLVAGFLLGLAVAAGWLPGAGTIVAVLATIGTIFVNLIRMTVIPLVGSMLVAGVAGIASSSQFGRNGIRITVVALGLLVAASVGSLLIAVPILERVPIDQAAALALRSPDVAGAAATGAAAAAPGFSQWLIELVPSNAFKAASDGAMIPVIVFAVLFGLALSRVQDARRAAVLQVVEGVADAMQKLIGWIIDLAPVGVFALAVPLAAKLGWSAAGAVGAYIALVVGITVLAALVLLYPLGIWAGPMRALTFVAYCAPAQAIAFAARSSLAALPVAMEEAERAGLPQSTTRLVLPMATAIFHFGAAVAQTVGVLFLARLFGVTLDPIQHASIVLAVVFASFAVPGVPGGSIIAMVPVLAVARVPIEGIGILLAVDTIPDMFRTTANLTGAMTLSAVIRAEPEGTSITPGRGAPRTGGPRAAG